MAPWVTKNVRCMIRKRNLMKKKMKKSHSSCEREYYKAKYQMLRHETLRLLRSEEKAYFDSLSSLKSDILWKKLKLANVHRCDNLVPATPLLSDPDSINNHFVDSIPDPRCSTHVLSSPSDHVVNSLPSFTFKPISEEDLFNVVRSLKLTSAASDGISGNMVLLCLPFCFVHLTHIVNYSLEKSEFPSAWKHGLVIPIPKVNNPSSYSDFRPITLVPFLSKILEKCVEIQIQRFLKTHSLLPHNQSGFRRGYSTTSSLTLLSDICLTAFDRDLVSVVCLLDFSRAFDTLSHDRLLSKLRFLNFSEPAIEWFSSYLSARSQSTVVRTLDATKTSSLRFLFRGVPQGSILGPLLFNIYVADLMHLSFNSVIQMYADDTQLIYSFHPSNLSLAVDCLNVDLGNIHKWSMENGLILNPNKSVYLFLDPTNRLRNANTDNFQLLIDGHSIGHVDLAKNLGLWMDSGWNFDHHVLIKCRAAYLRLRSLYQYRNQLTQSTKLMLCNTLILSLFNYSDIVYSPALSQRNFARVQSIQNACLRFCFNVRKYEHISPFMDKSDWLTMRQRWIFHLCLLVHSVLSSNSPSYLRDRLKLFSQSNESASRTTRFANFLLVIPVHRTTKFEASFSYLGPHFYNLIPHELKTLPYKSFCEKLCKFIKLNF